MNRVATAGAVVVIGLLCEAGPSLQTPAIDPALAAIKAEGLRGSQAPRLFHTLTDVIGPRLSGSPGHLTAARWAVERFTEWGLTGARLDPFPFGRGWTLEKLARAAARPRRAPQRDRRHQRHRSPRVRRGHSGLTP